MNAEELLLFQGALGPSERNQCKPEGNHKKCHSQPETMPVSKMVTAVLLYQGAARHDSKHYKEEACHLQPERIKGAHKRDQDRLASGKDGPEKTVSLLSLRLGSQSFGHFGLL
jgi:hypothetical protein